MKKCPECGCRYEEKFIPLPVNTLDFTKDFKLCHKGKVFLVKHSKENTNG